MPIPPKKKFLKTICLKCGWSEIMPQLSDVVFASRECKVCGSASVENKFVGLAEGLLSDPAGTLRSMLK